MRKTQCLSIPALGVVAVLLAAPSLAFATSAWHQGNGNIVHFTPEHVNANTREQVTRELETAISDGTIRFYRLNLPPPSKTPPRPKTRQQVVDELLNQSPEQLRAQKDFYMG
ncbi:DUF4148 domain-containing protein [Hydrogenophaga sp. NFH-34]|uniref:DUF4148 domain-containing protein n=1 Tax=Hydrogenophaga sp. NFH-34 TaxID=2744446 RepID=UPI001F16F054|nr:DUF4148 domain-containing protein [Hydrogenophaga sp. NFH-34]